MMEVYFDESGTHAGSPVVCIAGYLFTSEQARHMNREWAEALARFGLTKFHATDCGNGKKEFKHLVPQQRIELTKSVIGIVKRRMHIGFAVTMSETDFHQVPPPTWLKGGPYMICAMYALSGVSGWAEKNSYDGGISYFFEEGDKHQGATSEAIRELCEHPIGKSGFRYHSHAFVPKLGNGPLQAADLLAYEWFREIERLNGPNSQRPSRRSFDSLLQQPGYYAAHFGAADLDKFLKKDYAFMLENFGRLQKVE